MQTHPEFVPEQIDAPWFVKGENGTFRIWPHKVLGEGHFAAVLRKLEGREDTVSLEQAQKLPAEWTAFAKELGIQLPPGKALLFGENLFWAPQEMSVLKGLKVLRPGLELGQVRKGRFVPSHALALWLRKADNVHDLPAQGEHIKAYLHGETVPSAQKGWCLVTVDGYSIGWGKGDGNVLKNHYPKGLRR